MAWSFQSVKYGARTLRHSPAYTLAALLSLGLGIGANTAIFTLTNAVFLHPLPVKEPSRVIELYQVDHVTHSVVSNLRRTGLSYPNFVDLRDQNDVFTGIRGRTGKAELADDREAHRGYQQQPPSSPACRW
jgi:hypothetical protein